MILKYWQFKDKKSDKIELKKSKRKCLDEHNNELG